MKRINFSGITRHITIIISVLFTLFSTEASGQEYAIGADLSFLKSAEDRDFAFKENDSAKQGLLIFRDHGYNWIRLRLFHTPTTLPNNLDYTIKLAKEAKDLGFKFLLDYHYSDTWADPGKQYIPKAWEKMSHKELVRAVYDYTSETIRAFKDSGVLPEMVQIGNEVINGMLWPDGKLPENWDKPAPFPETPEGQKEFLDEVNDIVLNTPDNLGVGIFWWEPATMGGRSSRDYFDEQGNVLPVITVFDKWTRK